MSTVNNETQENPNSLTRGRVIIGATLLGLTVLMAIIMSIDFHLEERRGIPHADMPACERPESSDTDYSGTLPVDAWDRIGFAYVPKTSFGPSHEDDGAPTCYEHSPAGAVTAGVYIATLGSTGQTNTVLTHMSVDSPNTDRFREMVGSDEVVPSAVPEPKGLRLNNYTGDTANVSAVLLTHVGYRVVDIDLVWDDGDWKWNPPSKSLSVTTVNTLTGYNKIEEAPTNG